jgi:GT2 family glycosyltransferase
VLPLVRRQRPHCRLTIVGSGGHRFLARLEQPGQVEITDRVDDLTPFYQRAHVAIVPLRSGGGSRLKILEAMALGRPVVSSRLGCEGLVLEEGKDLLIADRPEAFACKILDLLADRERWRSMASSARKTVANRYDWGLVAQHLLSAYARIRPAPNGSAPSPLHKQWTAGSAPPRVSVIIPVYNALSSLDRCLDALEKSQLRDFELIVVDDHSTDGSESIAQERCANFVRLEKNCGAASARNCGARMARSELLFFLDSDVLIEPDTLDKIMRVFVEEPTADATFCAYQSDTPAKSFASQYKNLLHHYTHQVSGREAATFCGGYGAIRRNVFLQMGGFDERYRAMEDVELGYRLHQAGHRILLSSQIQLTHTKHYTLASLVRADVFQRAIPWTKVMLHRRIFHRDLNLRTNNLASMVIVFLMLLAPLLPGHLLPGLAATEATLLLLFFLLNGRFLAFLWRSRGARFALRSAPMIWLQYCYSGVGLALGFFGFMKDSMLRDSPSGPAETK